MVEVIELGTVDHLAAGAIGEPGQRAFYVQASKADARLTVLVEKEQVALLAAESIAFLDRLADEYPEEPVEASEILGLEADVREPAVPLFRAQLIGLGFDPTRELVLLELREQSETGDREDDEDDERPDAADDDIADGPEAEEGFVARLYATRSQVRAMAARGAEAVASGRPRCPLCDFPMDPGGHVCPRLN